MLISEFVERTGITPNADEWESINNVYMNATCDKDEFCALWCKSHGYTMNDVNSTLVNNYMWDNDLHGGQIYNALMIVTF